MIHRLVSLRIYFLPVQTRVPLKFGPEITTSVTCARVALRVVDDRGNQAEGWGETPLSVQWVWPSALPYEARHEALKRFCQALAPAWMSFQQRGHALELETRALRGSRHALRRTAGRTRFRSPRDWRL